MMNYKVGRLFVGLVLVVGFVCLVGDVRAEDVAVPAAINYQGMLTNPSDGTPVQAGVYHLEFRVWNDPVDTAEANLIWGRVFSVHVMTNGVFNILLTDDGTEVTSPSAQTNDIRQAFQGENRYLGLTITHGPSGVIDSPEISPRQRMVSAPFAFHSQNATDAYHAEHADEAVLAQNSDKLGGRLADRYYDKDNGITAHHDTTMVNARFIPAGGVANGITFPDNIGGGTGDQAGLKYFVAENAEDCELSLHVGNDAEDKIRIEASGDIEINAGGRTKLGGRIFGDYGNGYQMNRWYIASGAGMLTFHGYHGWMRFEQQDEDGTHLTNIGSNPYWSHYFDVNGADTMTITMHIDKGDHVKLSDGGHAPTSYEMIWRPFGDGELN